MFRYSAFIVFLLCFYSGLTAGDKTDDDILLLKLDKMIQQRETYQKKVEKDIAELRRTLDYVGDDRNNKNRYPFAQPQFSLLYPEYLMHFHAFLLYSKHQPDSSTLD